MALYSLTGTLTSPKATAPFQMALMALVNTRRQYKARGKPLANGQAADRLAVWHRKSSQQETVTVDGHRLRLTNLDKVLYPETGTTKAEVIAYYSEIAEYLIPHAADRPVTRKRWVHGVGHRRGPGQVFFQKNLDKSAPDWVQRHAIKHKSNTNDYPLANDRATLTWLAQIAALEIHVPQWKFGPRGKINNPDRMVLDLDPGEGAGLPECVEVAFLIKDILEGMGLDPMPVTCGSKGIHLYAGLDGKQTSDEVSQVAHELARLLEADHPDLVVSDMKKSLRQGKVLVDWSQNNGAKTTIAPYSLRGRPHPTVAVPRTWQELQDPDLAHLDFRQVLERVKQIGDPLSGMAGGSADEESLAAAPAADRLSVYRSMRDPDRTPEPVPAAVAPAGGGSTGLRDPGAPRPPPALRPSAGARRGAGVLGGAQGASGDHGQEPPRRADRGPPDGIRHLRGHHPQGRIRRRA